MIDRVVTSLKWVRWRLGIATTDRAVGLQHELAFWDEAFRTRGRAWPDDYRARLDPETPLSTYHRQFIDHLPQEEIRILDVGAGPLTVLGKTHPHKRLVVVATDVLAASYDRILEKYAVTPHVRTLPADAEQLSDIFGASSFDLVNAQNSIDHARDPLEAIRQMILVAREDCFVVLNHAENEAEHEGYHGLHQWNFSLEAGQLVVRSLTERFDVSRLFGKLATFEASREDRWVRVHIRKKRGG